MLVPYEREDGTFTFRNESDHRILPGRWEDFRSFSDDFYLVMRDGKWGLIDQEGNEAHPCRWESVDYLNEWLFAVEQDGKLGLMDRSGKMIAPCRWEQVGRFWNGRALAMLDGLLGYIDKQGNTVVPYQWKSVFDRGSWLEVEDPEGKWGVLDRECNVIVPCRWDYVETGWGCIQVMLDEKYGLFAEDGTELTPCQWDDMEAERDGCVKAKKNGGKWIVINAWSKKMLPGSWEQVLLPFRDGMAPVMQDGKWGFIDTEGELLIPCQWELVLSFLDLDGREQWGIANSKMAAVLCGKRSDLECFRKKLFPVEHDGKWDLTNGDGLVVHYQWDNAESIGDGYIWVKQGEKEGLVDAEGNYVIPCSLKNIFPEGKVLRVETLEGKWGLLDREGNTVIPCQWDEMEILT